MIFSLLLASSTQANEGSGLGSGMSSGMGSGSGMSFDERCYDFCDEIGTGFSDSAEETDEVSRRLNGVLGAIGSGLGSGMGNSDSGEGSGMGSGLESSSSSSSESSENDSDAWDGFGNGIVKRCYQACDEAPDTFDPSWFCFDFCESVIPGNSQGNRFQEVLSSCYTDCDGERQNTQKTRKVKFKSKLKGITEEEAWNSGPSVARVLSVPWDTVTVSGVRSADGSNNRRRVSAGTYDVDYEVVSEDDSTGTALIEATAGDTFDSALGAQLSSDTGNTVEVESTTAATMENILGGSNDEGSSVGLIAGIAVGAVAGVALVGYGVSKSGLFASKSEYDVAMDQMKSGNTQGTQA